MDFLQRLNGIIWGAPALVTILGVGLFLSIRTGFPQIILFPKALKYFFGLFSTKKEPEDKVSPLQALCTALAATVGTGNLVGVAGAICLGGPGAVFWMWIGGLLGMGTKFCETILAQRYRVKRGDGYVGGPMYTISNGMGKRWKPLAVIYSLFGLVAAFGVGNATQINAVISGISEILTSRGVNAGFREKLIMGLILGCLTGWMFSGGGKRIGQTAEKLVPIASAAYIGLCLAALILGFQRIPQTLKTIVQGAFQPRAVTGGMLGSAFLALRIGCARGVFTNEAGLGTASIAHAGADVDHPGRQGLLGIMEVFLDTIVICTMTALVILISGVPVPYSLDAGGALTMEAFSTIFGSWVGIFLTAALCCFAIATVLGWGLYGGRCAEFLFGGRGWKWFVLLQTATVVIGSVVDTGIVWLAAETVNGLMAIPNLIALAALTPELVRLTREFRNLDRNIKKG